MKIIVELPQDGGIHLYIMENGKKTETTKTNGNKEREQAQAHSVNPIV